ncbi:unnamed protein product [Rhizoctonia solani]|uniref:Mid2 domain-containing protein n=1 Tax=Rhizoctonia solani TaxID=456999 RepID=A0A8H2WN91_9AGAM|nr:unnamed protein product [Rhizoctonia solani]CAE6484424.1 unnamed protein product [Rhizoctonia solani]
MRVLLFAAIAYLLPSVAGWAFLVRSQVISEGASATFEITDDGGGFTFPYTMTVLKRVANSNDEQVGLVLTSGNETTFYWTCNQPAGTSVRFRLMSGAQVNAATSDYYEIQPSAQATASSLSVLSVQSTSSLYAKTQTTQGTGTASAPGATETSELSTAVSSKRISTGAIVGAIVGGILLLVALGIVAFMIRRRKRYSTNTQDMTQYDSAPHVTPFTHSQTTQTIIPPMGYVSQSNFEEEPPVYSPRDAGTTTYFTGSESGRSESSYRPSPSTGKSRYLPVRTQPNST